MAKITSFVADNNARTQMEATSSPRTMTKHLQRSTIEVPTVTLTRSASIVKRWVLSKKIVIHGARKKSKIKLAHHNVTRFIKFCDGYNDGKVLMASAKLKDSEWILDSGCTYHMTHNEHWLSDYQDFNEGKVTMGNNHSCSIAGIGSVSIKMADGLVRFLENVRWVTELSRNLIFISILDDLDYTNKREQSSMYIAKDAIVLKGINICGFYYLIG